jgi:S-adenosylmethionine decarboxylase
MSLLRTAFINLGSLFLLPTAGLSPERQTLENEAVDVEHELDREREGHRFFGRHLLVSYRQCVKRALLNHPGVIAALERAARVSGATVLSSTHHCFPGGGLTAVLLLAESHASIHTYPEHQACFVDLFTCGKTCRTEAFEHELQRFLCPASIDRRVLLRSERSRDEVCPSV